MTQYRRILFFPPTIRCDGQVPALLQFETCRLPLITAHLPLHIRSLYLPYPIFTITTLHTLSSCLRHNYHINTLILVVRRRKRRKGRRRKGTACTSRVPKKPAKMHPLWSLKLQAPRNPHPLIYWGIKIKLFSEFLCVISVLLWCEKGNV